MIERGALIVISSSGGKDSQSMTILLSRVVLREQLLIVHAPQGEVEWAGTVEHIETTIPAGQPEFDRTHHATFEIVQTPYERDRPDRALDVVCPERFQTGLLSSSWAKGLRLPAWTRNPSHGIGDFT